MKLRRLQISGFKSFMSPLELDFTSGITAIIGPNGCGKSNVVDAIRWVLGEQRTRVLRNTKMENVLFNGTRLRKPLGMAEVFLTLANDDHTLNLDYEEVTIGRRLFRSGASEYLVNGRAARLREIRHLLVDTGLGNSAYSIIERDMVERVVSEKGDEKRRLLEEAAGVSRYRIQRDEAERKIRATEQDLLRLVDILEELGRELRSLKYQMGKARRYQRLKEEADRLETVLLKSTLYDLVRRRAELLREREREEGTRLADDNEIAIGESRLQTLRVEIAGIETALRELNERRYALAGELQRHEERIAVHAERIASSRSRIDEDEEEIRRARERLETVAAELENARAQRQARAADAERLQQRLREREAALRDLSRRLDEARRELRERKQLALDLVRRRAEEKGALEHIERTIAELTQRQDAIETQMDELSAEETRRVEQLEAIEAEAARSRAAAGALQAEMQRLSRQLDAVGEESARCDADYAEVGRRLAELAEKREFLERVKQEHTRWSDETIARYEGLRGVFADFVHVDREYRRCFEACLMPVLRSIVAASRDDAVRAARRLCEGDASRAQILFSCDAPAEAAPLPRARGVVGRALDHVRCDAVVEPFVRAWLRDVVLARDVETAADLVASGEASRVATLDGVFFDGPGRIIVAGDDIGMTVLEYDAKLEELNQRIARERERERELAARREELARRRANLQEEISACRDRQRAAEEEWEVLQARRRDAELALVRVKQQITSLDETIAQTRASLADLRARLEAASAAESDPGAGGDAPPEDLGELEARVHELERRREEALEAVGALRVDSAAVRGELDTLASRIRSHEQLDEELQGVVRARGAEIERCREQIRLSEEDMAAAREAIAALHRDKETVEAELARRRETFEKLREQADALETEVRGMKEQRDAHREALERVSVELAALEERVASVIEKARENHDQDLAPYVDEPSRFDPAEWENFDREHLESVRRKLASFGPVNMLAMEEYEEKQERFEFLDAQKRDLEEARDALQQAIRRINREARRLLGETFERVRENFRRTFLTLFDGGEVELKLDSEDPLEANLRIVASPRGKRLHDISVLSTGEKALVALSFLFAIYLVKPSPFCVFDEVDAPLDDANVARFVRLLQSFTDRTQFIVITHNKKTMEAADHIYGVTMEEPGVSKLVSVRLDDAERFKRRGTTGPAESAARA